MHHVVYKHTWRQNINTHTKKVNKSLKKRERQEARHKRTPQLNETKFQSCNSMFEIWDSRCSRFQKPSAVISLQLCHLQYTQPILVRSKWLHSILAAVLTRHPRHPIILESLRPRGLHCNFTNGLSWPHTMTGFCSSLWPIQPYLFLATQSSAHIIQFCCQLEMQAWHPLNHRVLTLRKCFLEIFTSVTLVSS